jgi:hypothetical protein
VRARAALSKMEAMASVCRAWCFPSFLRSGLVAGEAVKLCRALSFSFVSLAGRGGEGRNGRWSVFRFCCRWCWWFSLVVLLRPAVVVRGAGSGGGAVMVLVVLGAAVAAGRWVEVGSWRCGCVRSTRPDSGASRRMDLAAFYNVWGCLLPSGRWYGVVDGD